MAPMFRKGNATFLCLGSQGGTVYCMGLLSLLLKADCLVLRVRHSLQPINASIIGDYAIQYDLWPQIILLHE